MATVTACRGCCCGTAEKHPGIDHDLQLKLLREVATVRVTGCLSSCDFSNVVVVQPTPEGRRRGGQPTWFGTVLDPEAAAGIAGWVRAGGPGLVELPKTLRGYEIQRPAVRA